LLREVEYFKGVLIMTTNRVAVFDPAVVSRIHHAVKFPQLSPKQQLEIWKLRLRHLSEQGLCAQVDEIQHWVSNAIQNSRLSGEMTGREIRNILIMAQNLGYGNDRQRRITLDDIKKIYRYKVDFQQDTIKLKTQAQFMQAGSMLQ
jgi:SpoVK/Ycf46/Vps4 family AAA+-type ATPase